MDKKRNQVRNMHKRTPKSIETVEQMVQDDAVQIDIASAIGITVKQLVYHYKQEIGTKKNGRPEYQVTTKDRRTVLTMTGYGIRRPDVARVLGISETTMLKYYRYELETSSIKANAQNSEFLWKNCEAGNITAQIWWDKSRAGMSETMKHEGGDSDKPIITRIVREVKHPTGDR